LYPPALTIHLGASKTSGKRVVAALKGVLADQREGGEATKNHPSSETSLGQDLRFFGIPSCQRPNRTRVHNTL
jgi:hypothetical protein